MKGPLIRVQETRGEQLANPHDLLVRTNLWLPQSLIDALEAEADYLRRTEPYAWKWEEVALRAIWRHVLNMKREMKAADRLTNDLDHRQETVRLRFMK